MKYKISYSNPLCHFIDIEAVFEHVPKEALILKLPSWRPGRYQLMHFSRNIQRFEVSDLAGNKLKYKKIGVEKWKIEVPGADGIRVSYNYFAAQMDGGSSWLDEHQLYVNPINCLLYHEESMGDPCHIELEIPEGYMVASQLSFNDGKAEAADYYQLVDSPFIASPSIRHFQCTVDGTVFHTWVQGQGDFEWDLFKKDVHKFASVQKQVMGPFPFEDYHFLVQFLPYKYYHGVEHFNSTVITLGPREEIDHGDLYEQFLGVCSHELFHAWNVCRMRPAEMQPYDFSKENYFETGFVAEGFTTYYGDLFLVRGGAIHADAYLKRLNKYILRHFDNGGRFNRSLAESSVDLWLDGYEEGIPSRKVSIYVKGAVVALMLDLQLLIESEGATRLDDLMRYMWTHFGANREGYTTDDLLKGLFAVSNKDYSQFFQRYIYGCHPIEKPLDQLLRKIGCQLATIHPPSPVERHLGIRLRVEAGHLYVRHVAPLSPAYGNTCVHDRILELDGQQINPDQINDIGLKDSTTLLVERSGQKVNIEMKKGEVLYFTNFEITRQDQSTEHEQRLFDIWLG
jgi:predicted metalloprotease with PDZ domain